MFWFLVFLNTVQTYSCFTWSYKYFCNIDEVLWHCREFSRIVAVDFWWLSLVFKKEFNHLTVISEITWTWNLLVWKRAAYLKLVIMSWNTAFFHLFRWHNSHFHQQEQLNCNFKFWEQGRSNAEYAIMKAFQCYTTSAWLSKDWDADILNLAMSITETLLRTNLAIKKKKVI